MQLRRRRNPLVSWVEDQIAIPNNLPPDAMADLAEGRARLIRLTRGMVAIVDSEDYGMIAQYNWCAGGNPLYAMRVSRKSDGLTRRKTIMMHRVIAKTPSALKTDHKNLLKWDNRKSNLRTCTQRQNQFNHAKSSRNTTGFKGVHFAKHESKFIAQMRINGRKTHLGSFGTAIEAHQCYCEASQKYHKEFSRVQ